MRSIVKLLRFALKAGAAGLVVAVSLLSFLALENGEPSTCFGSSGRGRLENAKRLPLSGENFSAYWSPGWLIGRTGMHGTARDVIAEAYERLEQNKPDLTFVYGESGWPWGGRFWPHRTHQNGLSVDFVVPVRGADNQSVAFPRSMLTGGFYAVDMDDEGRFADGRIDFDAMAAHLLVLRQVGESLGAPIRRVFFDPALQPMLFATADGRTLASQVRFSGNRSWFRHDAHYHVDFDVPCRQLER